MASPLLSHPSTTIQIQEKAETIAAAAATKQETSPPFVTCQIRIRIAVVLAIVATCIVVNHVASNSFEVSFVNADANTPKGRQFDLMFVSNGKISQLLYSSNQIIEQLLYPTSSFPKKPINHITINLLGDQNLTNTATVHPGVEPGEFSILLGSGFLSSVNPANALQTVLHRALSRVRVWDGPEEAVGAMVEYLVMHTTSETIDTVDARSDGSCWSGGFIRYCESRENGFVARLNRQFRDRSGLGLLNRSLCEAYKASSTKPQMARTQSSSHLVFEQVVQA